MIIDSMTVFDYNSCSLIVEIQDENTCSQITGIFLYYTRIFLNNVIYYGSLYACSLLF